MMTNYTCFMSFLQFNQPVNEVSSAWDYALIIIINLIPPLRAIHHTGDHAADAHDAQPGPRDSRSRQMELPIRQMCLLRILKTKVTKFILIGQTGSVEGEYPITTRTWFEVTYNVLEEYQSTSPELGRSSCRHARGWWCQRPSVWTHQRLASHTQAACSLGPCKSWNLSQKRIWKEKEFLTIKDVLIPPSYDVKGHFLVNVFDLRGPNFDSIPLGSHK